MRSDGRTRLVALGVGLLLTACGSTDWQRTPDGPIGPRAFAAVACNQDGMTITGGATPSNTGEQNLVTGTAFLGPSGWTSIPDPPIEPRMEAVAAAMTDGATLVWGGRDGTVSGSQASDFTYYSNGAVLDPAIGTWRRLPLGPLAPRTNAQIVTLRDGFVVAGGEASPGSDVDRSPQAALYSPSSDSWLQIQVPEHIGALAGGQRLLNFDTLTVDEYDFVTESWKPIAAVPEDARGLAQAATRGAVTAVATDSRVWLFEDTFASLPGIPGVHIDYLGWAGDSVAVWDNTEGVLSIYDQQLRIWIEAKASADHSKLVSPALCAFETGFAVWGGWIDRGEGTIGVRIALGSGTIIEFDPADS